VSEGRSTSNAGAGYRLSVAHPALERAAPNPVVALQGGKFRLRELMANELPPLQWVVPGILPEGVTILSGKPKLGKSWLVLGLCIAVASGGRALGHIPVEKGRVLYLALEDGPRRLQRRCRKILAGQLPLDDIDFALAWPRLDTGGLDEIERWIQQNPNGRLIVVDTLWRVRPMQRGSNQYSEDYQALAGLQTLAQHHSVAILLVHHTRKGESDDPLEDVSGTNGLTGVVDGNLVLQRRRQENSAILHVSQREGEEGHVEMALVWDPVVVAWTVAGSGEEFRMTKERNEILSVLAESIEPMSPADLAQLLQLPVATVKMRVSRMLRDRQIESPRLGKYALPQKAEDALEYPEYRPLPLDPDREWEAPDM
jgi:hypothetical protein